MKVKFWGVRGSIPSPGPETAFFGGNTACVEIIIPERPDEVFILDAGTGIRKLGLDLLTRKIKKIHLFISHTHWDHIQGFPFFVPAFMKGTEIDIYGPKSHGRNVQQALTTQMEYDFFPVPQRWLPSQMKFIELVEESHQIGDIKFSTKISNHPVITLGFKFEYKGRSLYFSGDMEKYYDPFEGMDAEGAKAVDEENERHANFLKGCNLVIHDAQYTEEEYAGKKGWGHSTFEQAMEFCNIAKAEKLYFWSHDPTRTDDELKKIVVEQREKLKKEGSKLIIEAAREGETIEV